MNGYLPASNRDAPFVHVVSALTAGVSVSTLTNPIWLIKTRLQLDRTHSSKTLTIRKAVKQIYNEKVRKFWEGCITPLLKGAALMELMIEPSLGQSVVSSDTLILGYKGH